MKYQALFVMASTAVLVLAAPARAFNYKVDFSQTSLVDNLWDGVNRKNEVQVFDYTQHIIVNGSDESAQRFGACPRVGDINGDGRDELVVSDGRGFVWIYPLGPRGANRTVGPGKFIHTYFGDCTTISLCDWNNDGLIDLVCGNHYGTVIVCRNRGKGEFTTADAAPAFMLPKDPYPYVMVGSTNLDIGNYSAPLAVDWERIGKPDLIVGDGTYSANAVYLYRNIGKGATPQFSSTERYWLAYGFGSEQLVPTVGDLDGDGDLDLVVGEREGYVDFYANEPGTAKENASDEKAKYLLQTREEQRERLSFDGELKPVGPMVRPELTDWDGDGKLDLLLGADDGHVYLAMNNGTKKKAAFQAPKPLESKDVLKPYFAPTSWKVSHRWYETENSWNSGAYIHMVKETNETGKAEEFVRYEFADDYVGFSQRIMFYGVNPNFPVGQHAIVMKCRAQNLTEMNGELEHHETARVAGSDTLKEAWPVDYVTLKATPSWQVIRQTFNIQPQYPENNGTLTKIEKSFRLEIKGTKGLMLDIGSIQFE